MAVTLKGLLRGLTRTPEARDEEPFSILFGSCRAAAPHEPPWSLSSTSDPRGRGVDSLRALLEWEHAHGDRPPYVTMLSNRIATIAEG